MMRTHKLQNQISPPTFERLRGRSFLSTGQMTHDEFQAFIETSWRQKNGALPYGQPLKGKQVGLVFFNPSLRTRVSMATAVLQLGGTPLFLEVGKGVWDLEHRDGVVMNEGKPEHVRDAVPLLSSYCDLLAVRCFPQLENYALDLEEPILGAFARFSHVPVINLESSMDHPCQALADALTMREVFTAKKPKKTVLHWTYHPKALPLAVGNSFALAAVQAGHDLEIVNPPEFDLPARTLAELSVRATLAGGSVSVTHNRQEAYEDAEIIYAKSWVSCGSYGDRQAESALRENYRDWIITPDVMSQTSDAYFMHCLPVRRNVEVADAVIDGPRSLTQRQGQNRLFAQKSLIAALSS